MWASELNEFNTGNNIVNGTCGGGPFFLGMGEGRSCEEFSMKVGYSSVVLKIDGWTFKVLGNWVYGSISGPTHRLDVTFNGKGDAASRYLPHGIVGQSFASDMARHGLRDFYPLSGRVRTMAQAEGAIEGDASMYEAAGPFATEFRFSRFSSALVAVSSGLLADGDASAISDGDASAIEAAYAPPSVRRLAEAPCAPPPPRHLIDIDGGSNASPSPPPPLGPPPCNPDNIAADLPNEKCERAATTTCDRFYQPLNPDACGGEQTCWFSNCILSEQGDKCIVEPGQLCEGGSAASPTPTPAPTPAPTPTPTPPPSPPVPCQYNLYTQSGCRGDVGQTIDGFAEACWDRTEGADSGVTYNDMYSSVRINGAGCQIKLMRECPEYTGANPSLTFTATDSNQCFGEDAEEFLWLEVSSYRTSQA